jgi:hypothetical protein
MRKFIRKLPYLLELIFELLLGLGGMAQSAPSYQTVNTVRLNIDFGSAAVEAPVLAKHAHYRYQRNDCPDDGRYALLTGSTGCFGNKWHSLAQDHTPGDVQGRMLVVNAAIEPGPFFTWRATGLTPGSKMQLGAWITNICYTADGCKPTPPIIRLSLRTDDGRLVGLFETGAIQPTNVPQWQCYTGDFTVPDGVDVLTLVMENLIKGGCGNDFAVDDISLKEYSPIEPPIAKETPIRKPVVISPTAATPKPVAPPTPSPSKPTAILPKPDPQPIVGTTSTTTAQQAPAPPPTTQILPPPIATRANPVVKTIEAPAGEILIDLYDNGDIDGDIISVYNNNRLVVNRATLSGNPVTLRITIDKNQPYHELVMVAENLGSIPPNTSLMIITAQNKRYEVFISSSEQKNAKVVLLLEK